MAAARSWLLILLLLSSTFVAACGASDPAPSGDTGAHQDIGAADVTSAVDAASRAADTLDGALRPADTGVVGADSHGSAVADGAAIDDIASGPSDTSAETPDGDAAAPDDASAVSPDVKEQGLQVAAVAPAAPVSAVVTNIISVQTEFVRSLAGKVLYSGAKGPALHEPDIDFTTNIKGVDGDLVDAVVFAGVTLTATTKRLYALVGDVAKPSPIGDALAGKGKNPKVSELLVTSGKTPDLWIVADNKLHLLRAGKLHHVTVKGMTFDGAKLAWGAKVNGKPALWVAVGKKIAGILVDGKSVQAWVEIDDRQASAIGVDSAGNLLVASEGICLVRNAVGAWLGWKWSKSVKSLVGAPSSPETFIDVDGELWMHAKGSFHRLEKAPAIKAWAATVGGLLVATAKQVARLQTKPPPVKPKTTWSKDVQPIYLNSCDLCHSAKGVNTKLYKASQWKTKYNVLWKLVVNGGMPLAPKDPLTPAELAVIKKWKQDGFVE